MTALSFLWRFLLAIALVANPLVGMASGPKAEDSPAQLTPCQEMGMEAAGHCNRSIENAAGRANCHDHGCPDPLCGSACKMGVCAGNCLLMVAPVLLPVWRGPGAEPQGELARAAGSRSPMPLIRPPIA